MLLLHLGPCQLLPLELALCQVRFPLVRLAGLKCALLHVQRNLPVCELSPRPAGVVHSIMHPGIPLSHSVLGHEGVVQLQRGAQQLLVVVAAAAAMSGGGGSACQQLPSQHHQALVGAQDLQPAVISRLVCLSVCLLHATRGGSALHSWQLEHLRPTGR